MGAQFCVSCGHRLEAPAQKEEERKLVTVLFADLTGSTALGEQLDPERLRELLREYFGAMESVIEAWGGTVEKFIGDAVMAVFGVPSTHEDDAERALRAALEMQARLEEMNPEILGRHGVRLAMRIGVNTGEVIAGAGDDPFMVAGDVVNVAARLQQTAEPGEVAVGDRTYHAARGGFVFEPLDDRSLKGKSAPVRAWRLVEPSELVRPRGLPGLVTRLVGREHELSLLESLYAAALEEQRPRLVTVLGEAGVGKTRLTEEFLARAESGGSPAEVHRGRCLPYGQGITYWALREILWGAAGILLADPATLAAEKLRKLVEQSFEGADARPDEIDRVMFSLAITAGISLPDNPLEQISPESIGEELGIAWPRFVSALARGRPAIVVIEDLHWAEAPLLDMLEGLVSRTTGPAMIIATARPEFAAVRPGWSGRSGMSQIGLEPLAETQARELVRELLPGAGAELQEKVFEAAEGNPFFAEEIVAHLIDQGILSRRDGVLVEAERAVHMDLPDTVRALLAARVDTLPAEEKRTLQDAAVVGRVFWAAALERMRPEGPARPVLHALEERGLVVTRPSSALPGQIELAFNHGLTREAAYESIPRARRARAHGVLAEWIEELAGDRRGEFVDLIAYHLEAAAKPEDAQLAWPGDTETRERLRKAAIGALLQAGEAAKTRYAIDEAIGFADRALSLSASDGERLASLELKARAGHAGVRVDEAWGWYLEAMEVADPIENPEARKRLQAHATLLWSRYGGAFSDDTWKTRAREVVEQGLRSVDEREVSFEVGALLTGRATFFHWRMAPRSVDETRRDAERGIDVAEAIGSSDLRSYALDALYGAVMAEGFCGLGDMAERLIAAARNTVDRVEGHELIVTAARAHVDAGNFEPALEVAGVAAEQAARLSTHHRLHAAAAQTKPMARSGLLGDLLAATKDAPELVAEEGSRTCGMGALALAGHVAALHEAARDEEARKVLDLLEMADLQSLRGGETRYFMVEILRPHLGLDPTRERLGGMEPPEDVAAAVMKLRTEMPLAALVHDWDALGRLVEEARAIAEPACAPFLTWIADWSEAMREAAAGHNPEAVLAAREAAGHLREFGDRYLAVRLLVDFLPFAAEEAAALAAEVIPELESMGATATAAEARRFA